MQRNELVSPHPARGAYGDLSMYHLDWIVARNVTLKSLRRDSDENQEIARVILAFVCLALQRFNVSTMAPTTTETDDSEIDPIWTTSRTARQIYALGEVDKARTKGKSNPLAHSLHSGHNSPPGAGFFIYRTIDPAPSGWP